MEAIGDNCIKQIKTVTERQICFLSFVVSRFYTAHKITHSIKVEEKLCEE